MSDPIMEKIPRIELETEGGTVVIMEFRLDGENSEVIKGRYKHANPLNFDIWWDGRGLAKREPHKWDLDRTNDETERLIQHVARRRREYMLNMGRRR